MGSLGEAVVEVRADLAPLSAGLGKADGMVSGFVGSTGNAILSGVTTALATKGIESVAATGHALFEAAAAAADLGETFSKVRTTFGADAKKVEDFADDMADRFGLVRREVLDASASIGLIGQGAGLSASKSAELSVNLAKLAADASSFYNVPLPVALEKIRSGLVGESEPLRAFGVLLSEDAVKAEAFRSGLARAGDELNEQQKVIARAAIITRQLATASGDLERTQDSASNQMRKFAGDIENFKAEVGASFIGPLTEAMKLAREFGATLAKVGGDNPGDAAGQWAKSWIGAIRLVNAAWDPAKFRVALQAAGRGENGLQALADDLEGVEKFDPSRIDQDGVQRPRDSKALNKQLREQREAREKKQAETEAADPRAQFRRRFAEGAGRVQERIDFARDAEAARTKRAFVGLGQVLADAALAKLKAVPQLLSGDGAGRRAALGTLASNAFGQARVSAPAPGEGKPIVGPPEPDVRPGHSLADAMARDKAAAAVGPTRAELDRGRAEDRAADRLETFGRTVANLEKRGGPDAVAGFLAATKKAEAVEAEAARRRAAGGPDKGQGKGQGQGPAEPGKGGLAKAAEAKGRAGADVGPASIMGAEDYGSLALTAPMNAAKEKALAEAEKANELLGTGNDLLGKIFEALNRGGGGGGGGRAVLRGRS